MQKFDRRENEPSAQERLDTDPKLQALFTSLTRGGPAACGYAICTLLDHLEISADAFDYILGWTVADLKGWCFDTEVPQQKPTRRKTHLRLVPPQKPGP